VLAAYAALVLGVSIKDNYPNEEAVKMLLGPTALQHLTDLLSEFVHFQARVGLTTVQSSFTEVIAYLNSRTNAEADS